MWGLFENAGIPDYHLCQPLLSFSCIYLVSDKIKDNVTCYRKKAQSSGSSGTPPNQVGMLPASPAYAGLKPFYVSLVNYYTYSSENEKFCT